MLVAVGAVMAVVLAGGPGPVTSVRLTSMISTSGDPAAGTVQAHVTQPQHATVRHAAMTSSAAATGSLSTVLSESVHGGYTAAGIGMRNLGYGTISITGIPAGATVESATLLWDILADSAGPSFAQGALNGQALTGTQWASGDSPADESSGFVSIPLARSSLAVGDRDQWPTVGLDGPRRGACSGTIEPRRPRAVDDAG